MTVTTIGASRKYAYVPYELSTLPDTLENVRSFGDDRLIPEGFRPQKTISFSGTQQSDQKVSESHPHIIRIRIRRHLQNTKNAKTATMHMYMTSICRYRIL